MPSISTHALEECERRHGFTPCAWDADLAVLDIIEGRAEFAGEGSEPGRERYLVRLGHVVVPVVYDPPTARIVTVLTAPKRDCEAA